MKLLVDVRTMASRPSGVGLYIYSYLKNFVLEEEIELVLITDVVQSREIKQFKDLNIKIYEYGKLVNKSVSVFPYFKYVKSVLKKEKADFFWEPNNVIPIKLKNPYGKVILTVHDVFPLMLPECFSRIYRIYFKYSLKKALESADILFYDSKETKKNMEYYFSDSIEKKSLVSYVIVEEMEERPASDEGYFFYVGNLEKRKGTDILLKGFELYRRAGGKKKLYMAGKMREDEIEQLYDQVKKSTSAVTYLGYITTEEKMDHFSKCSCFVFPSRDEGFGIPPVEAMYYGKSIIVSDLEIFHEILGEAVNYIASANEDDKPAEELLAKIMECYQQPDLGKYKDVIERYSGSRLTKRCLEFLKSEA